MALDKTHFTLVFEGDIGKFERNPLRTETPFGVPIVAGRGNAFEEVDRITEIVNKWTDSGHILLHAGEMTAQELRSVKAVVSAILREIEEN